jgi:hypothetical protein
VGIKEIDPLQLSIGAHEGWTGLDLGQHAWLDQGFPWGSFVNGQVFAVRQLLRAPGSALNMTRHWRRADAATASTAARPHGPLTDADAIRRRIPLRKIPPAYDMTQTVVV